MPRIVDMPVAARRTLAAANSLPASGYHVAGYLYGLAAECAVKAMMKELGIRSLASVDRREDPYYHHFPALLSTFRDAASGRRSRTLTRTVNQPSFMGGWSTDIRYAATGEVTPAEVERWRAQAKQAVASIGT